MAPVYGDDTTGGKGEMTGGGDVGRLTIGDHREIGQIAVVVEEQMELNGAFGLAEVSPREKAQTKVDVRNLAGI